LKANGAARKESAAWLMFQAADATLEIKSGENFQKIFSAEENEMDWLVNKFLFL
jgi:hypothetical protein